MDEFDDEIDEPNIPDRSPAEFLRRVGLGHLVTKKNPEKKTADKSPPTFFENLVLAATRDISAQHAQPDVSMLEVFQAIAAGLKKNYRGKNFAFAFGDFENTARTISTKSRKWVAMREPTNRRLTATIRLEPIGLQLAAILPAVGTPLTPAHFARFGAVLEGAKPKPRPRPPHWKAKQPEKTEPRGLTADEVTYMIAKAMLDALKAMQAKKDPTNEGTTTTTTTEGTDRKP